MTTLSENETKWIEEEEENVNLLLKSTTGVKANDNRERLLEQIYELRDSLSTANSDDIPQLTEQIERLTAILGESESGGGSSIDLNSPYFAHFQVQDGDKDRDYFLGTEVFRSKDGKIQIVDWKRSPISVIYYRYDEEDEFEEEIGGRIMEGVLRFKRSVNIVDRKIVRIQQNRITLFKNDQDVWEKEVYNPVRLKGGTGAAARPESLKKGNPKLGVGHGGRQRKDKHLPSIAALLDREQFDLITRPESGTVAIQGTAGSGKTTIALHRVAWLHFQDKRRFAAHRMMVVVFNKALANYISQVLPSLGVQGVRVEIYENWTAQMRQKLYGSSLPQAYTDTSPVPAIRLKKHPAMITIIADFIRKKEELLKESLRKALAPRDFGLIPWASLERSPLAKRIFTLSGWIEKGREIEGKKYTGGPEGYVIIQRELAGFLDEAKSTQAYLVQLWDELFSDFAFLTAEFKKLAGDDLSEETLKEAMAWCKEQYLRRISDGRDEGNYNNDPAAMDHEDDPLLLYLYQTAQGDIPAGKKTPLKLAHIMIDEAQDLSPLELKVLFNVAATPTSVTLAGDVNQKIIQHNGFEDWDQVFEQLGLKGQRISPLRVSYRSTYEIMEFALGLLGEKADAKDLIVNRRGAPVELFQFGNQGELSSWLSESLKTLLRIEPLASVAVICATQEIAFDYFNLLDRYEIPRLRYIGEQDFPFKPGIDVTDVKQVKGLEFDYVILLDADTVNYPDNSYARFLLHVAATRAAHQLWLMNYRKRSFLLPERLTESDPVRQG